METPHTAPHNLLERLQVAWTADRTRSRAMWRLVKQAGSADPAARQAAAMALADQPELARPHLIRGLQCGVPIACGAAAALHLAGDSIGIDVVLRRSYEEEWLLRSFEDGYPEGISSLCWLDPRSVGSAMDRALRSAAAAVGIHDCVGRLSIAISALRILLILPESTSFERWESAFLFGRRQLTRIPRSQGVAHGWYMTDTVRAVALRGLMQQHPGRCTALCLNALDNEDTSVARLGIAGLYRLGGPQAVEGLQRLAFSRSHALSALARRALAGLLGDDAEPITLLRPATPEPEDQELLRSLAHEAETDSELLHPARPWADHHEPARRLDVRDVKDSARIEQPISHDGLPDRAGRHLFVRPNTGVDS